MRVDIMSTLFIMLTDAIASVKTFVDDPNKRADSQYLGKYSSISEFDAFISRFNHENNYNDGTIELNLGDSIKIYDSTHSLVWMIAGFDCEYNRMASDGTVYDNGYGIMLIPKYSDTLGYYNNTNTVAGGYKSSLAHSKAVEIATTIKNAILGSHLVNRNVLLSSISNSNGNSDAYTWTTAYATLPSIGQIDGFYANNSTIYDDGEANYILPIFKYRVHDFPTYWTRNIGFKEDNSNCRAWAYKDTIISMYQVNTSSFYYRPLIYIR